MKKNRNDEARPAEKQAEKQPQVKSLLLQTYFTSLLCLVLCVSMFFGTSYAWFTSEVTNTANEMYVGTLAVGLYKETASGVSQDLANTDTKLFNSNIRWEPGYTTLETIQVVNKGDLAFKYELTLTDGSLDPEKLGSKRDVDAKLMALAEYFEVYAYHHTDSNAPAPKSYEDINHPESGWIGVSLADALENGTSVLEGTMASVRDTETKTPANDGTTDGVATTDRYTIALHMSEETPIEITYKDSEGKDNTFNVMGQKIKLNVKLVAYQTSSETDDFESHAYDDITRPTEATE